MEKDLQCHTPGRLELPPEKPLVSSLAKQEGEGPVSSVLTEEAETAAALQLSALQLAWLLRYFSHYVRAEASILNWHS